MQVINTHEFISKFIEQTKKGKKFCFIVGSGASKTSGIPTGFEMMRQWKKELDKYSDQEINERIHSLLSEKDIGRFDSIEAEYKKLFHKGYELKNEDYSKIYDIRFYHNEKEGFRYLEDCMENVFPNIGYYYLAEILSKTNNRIVITTNFDSLIEDAVHDISKNHPLVIGHEFLAEYILERNKGPILIKIHRDLLLSPMSKTTDLAVLKDNWKEPISAVLQQCIPVVIGYSGGDNTLMSLLEETDFNRGLYWCVLDGNNSKRIETLIIEKRGTFVKINGFDDLMYGL